MAVRVGPRMRQRVAAMAGRRGGGVGWHGRPLAAAARVALGDGLVTLRLQRAQLAQDGVQVHVLGVCGQRMGGGSLAAFVGRESR